MWFSRSTPAVVPRGPSVAVPVVVAGDTERRRFCPVGSLGFDSLSHKRFMCTVFASLLRNPKKKNTNRAHILCDFTVPNVRVSTLKNASRIKQPFQKYGNPVSWIVGNSRKRLTSRPTNNYLVT